MVLIGKHITTIADPLQPVAMDKLYKATINADSEVATLQRRLQAVKMLDLQQYRKLKTGLPYIVCAQFQPKIRKKENFLYTERFIVDIDHLSASDLDVMTVKNKLKEDPRVEFMFTSPGGDGLKVFFALREKISDSAYYAMFYKSFCLRLASEYRLGDTVDTKTNDVTRCCFTSHDATAYYNPAPEKIIAAEYMPEVSSSGPDIFLKALQKEEKEISNGKKNDNPTAGANDEIPDEVLNTIKQKIGMRVKAPRIKEYEQPEQLDTLMKELAEQLDQVGATVISSKPISYGRQVKIGAGKYWAEINLFYGQRGVSIVPTTKTGSNKELCDQIVLLLKSHFDCH
ncbi:MAG: hypothetical protein JST21_01450 [Bacteroidetes bacterium]|nr:hypothetical protein [Bacteroidota bacterium]